MTTGRRWLARLIVGLDLLVWCTILLFEPLSVTSKILDRAGPSGHLAFVGMIALGVIAIIDVIVNDLMPSRFIFGKAIRHRHFVYMLMCLGCLSTAFVIIKSLGFSVVLLHYGLIALAALLIALLDVRDRIVEHHQST